MLLALWWTMNMTTVRTDLGLFLPAGSSPVERLLLNELNSGPATRLLLLAIEGGSEEQRVSASRELARVLQQSELFSKVENGSFSLDTVQQRPLFRYRYLLSPQVDQAAMTTKRLREALQARLDELHSPLPSPFKQLLPNDPTGEYRNLLGQWLPQSRPPMTQGVWSSEDGARTLLLAETRASAFSIDVQQRAVDLIQRSFQALDQGDRLHLVVSGPGAIGIQSRALIQSETRDLSLLASAGVILLLFLAYRSKRLLLLSMLPLASALLAGVALTSLIFGELHGITLAFGITLLGITIDYPLHLFSHLRQGESANLAVMRIWRTLRLGVLTTCVGYLVLITTDFGGLQQLGVFTVTGLLTAALSSRLILPALLGQSSQKIRLRGIRHLSWVLQPATGASRLSLALGLLLIISLSFAPGPIWQDDIGALTPTSKGIIQQDRELRGQLRAPEPNQLVIIHGQELETTLPTDEQLSVLLQTLVDQGAIGGFESANRYLPSMQTQQSRQAALPMPAVMQRRLHEALEGQPFRAESFSPFLDDLETSRHLAPLTYSDLAGTPPGIRLKALLREREDSWLLITPLSQVSDGAAVAKLLEQQLPAAEYLNLRTETSRLVAGFRDQVLERLGWGVAVMLLVLGFGLRSLGSALRALLPVALAIGSTMALLYWLGISLTLFHLVSLMLVLGIGLDYSLFFGRHEEDLQERTRTLHALLICAISTSLVFGVLGSSEVPVLQAIGQTVALGVVSSFILTFTLARRPPLIAQPELV